MYVKIVNQGECFSTTMEFINGVYANRDEWAKYNFYPKNGMVGELVKRTPSAYIIKIKDGIYVPMKAKGVEEITYEEYVAGLPNNVCDGMDARQQRINDNYNFINTLTGNNWRQLPNMRGAFRNDVIENMKRLTCDFKRNIFMPDLEKSFVMYALDMCLEYQDKSGRKIDPMTIQGITNQIGDVYMELFSKDFDQANKNRCTATVIKTFEEDNTQNIRDTVFKYYQDVTLNYCLS